MSAGPGTQQGIPMQEPGISRAAARSAAPERLCSVGVTTFYGMPVQAIGWVSSLILVLTIGHQVRKQWREGSTEGVSKWLFLGQTAASIGFTIYSWLVRDWVFVVTNALMMVNGLLGCAILFYNRRRARRRSSPAPAPA
jgi:MtN3 and saliva related transmembrane protein